MTNMALETSKFEMSFSSFKNLVEVEKDLYRRTDENLKLGDYDLHEVDYQFYKWQLSTVIIETKGYTNSRVFYIFYKMHMV